MKPLFTAALVLACTSLGCIPEPHHRGDGSGEDDGSPLMAPGQDCMQCHADGERVFTAAGTIFSSPNDPTDAGVSGVTVLITDALGKQLSLQTNAAGNFFTGESLTFPISAELQRGGSTAKMMGTVPSGSCASCHSQPPLNGAPGRAFVSP